MDTQNLMDKTYIIATHNFAFGTSQALKKYFERHKITHVFIQHELFANPLTLFLGMADTFWKVLQNKEHFDVFIGSNRLNAFIGIWLKKVGKVSKVVYFSPDWVEDRFGKNYFLNKMYQWLDYFCVVHTDITWNSSTIMDIDPMMQKRLDHHYPKRLLKKQIQVPDGTDEFPYINLQDVNPFRMGFIGHLRAGMGAEMIIKTYLKIKRDISQLSCVIIGSGPEEERLRDMAKNTDIEFTGYMGDIKDVYKTLSQCAIALAPYQDIKDNMSLYTDPGKVKVYLSVSLPVIITKVPQIAYEIHSKEAGIAVNDNEEEFSHAIELLLSDQKTLEQYRQNAYDLSKKYSWDNVFQRAVLKTFYIK